MCNLTRKNSGLNKISPKYDLNIHKTGKFLMSAKKNSVNLSSNFTISTSQEKFDKNDNSVIGKLKANFIGSEYCIYGNGKNPKETKKKNEIRREYGCAVYEKTLFSKKGPRKMTVFIPEIDEFGDYYVFKPTAEGSSLINKSKSLAFNSSIQKFTNKQPVYSEEHKAYFLNFGGRVEVGSVKNFQLVKGNEDYLFLQFGKVNKETFALDFQFPFSPLQAFALSLSSLDRKIACD